MTVGERIKILRERRQMTGVQLAIKTGLNQSYLSKVERNSAGWSNEGLEAIARALGVTPGMLLDGVADEKDEPPLSKYGMIPVFELMLSGSPRGDGRNFSNEAIDTYVYCDLPHPEQIFAMIVRGASMAPEFAEGDLVFFRRGVDPQPGAYVAATNPRYGATFRRFRDLGEAGGHAVFALTPLNNSFPEFRSDEGDWKLEGVMVRLTRNYKL